MKYRNQHPLLTRFNHVMLATSATAVPVGMVVLPTQADGAIVASGIVNLNIANTTNGLYLNVLNGAFNEPGNTAGASVPGWDVNFWSSTGFGLFNPTSPSGGVYVVTAPNFAENMAPGALIDAAATYGSGSSANIAQWNLNSSDNLVGFRFLNEDTGAIHYGWARIEFDATITSRRLVEYVYEDEAGVGILAGQYIAIPETSTMALLALGATGLAMRRRRAC